MTATFRSNPDLTYLTLDGDLLDLTGLSSELSAHFKRAHDAWLKNLRWDEFVNNIQASNPLLEPGKRVSRAVFEHPLYRATVDLGDRLGIAQGELRADDANISAVDPLADEWISIAEAASERDVTQQAIRLAITRGDLIASASRPQKVSARSLQAWHPSVTRQRAGRARLAV